MKWLPCITTEDESKIVVKLLPQTGGSFEMATFALISDFCTDEERAAIFDRYLKMFDAALSTDDTTELGNLLALAVYWNSSPSIRPKLAKVTNQASQSEISPSPRSALKIAAEIYEKKDSLTGKYEVSNLTA